MNDHSDLSKACRTKHPTVIVDTAALRRCLDELDTAKRDLAAARTAVGRVDTVDDTLAVYQSYAPRAQRAIANAATYLDGYPSGADSSGAIGVGDSRTMLLGLRHAYGNEKTRDDGTVVMSGPDDRHGALHRKVKAWVDAGADLVNQLAPNQKTADHLATKADDVCPAGSCVSCWRDGGHRSQTRKPGGRMCLWCEKTARNLDVDMPPLMLVQRHNRGQRITERDVRLATGGHHA